MFLAMTGIMSLSTVGALPAIALSSLTSLFSAFTGSPMSSSPHSRLLSFSLCLSLSLSFLPRFPLTSTALGSLSLLALADRSVLSCVSATMCACESSGWLVI